MSRIHQEIVFVREVSVELTLEELAACTGLHPELLERFVSFGLIEPMRAGAEGARFAAENIPRLRAIERLRRDLGANLASIGVIFDLLDRIETMERELARLRRGGG